MNKQLICQRCGKSFINKREIKYCSEECRKNNGKHYFQICRYCKKPFKVINCQKGKRMYCSMECLSNNSNQIIVKCKVCGKEVRTDGVRKDTFKYCSMECRKKDHIAEPRLYRGRQYYMCRNGEGKEILYHRYIMEKHIGRKLLITEIVHHIDENTLNNSLDNLVIMSRKEHIILHKTQECITKEYTCLNCKKIFTKLRKLKCKFCSKSCSTIYSNKHRTSKHKI